MADAGFFVNAELSLQFFDATSLLQSLAQRALQGAEEFTVRPALPLYLPGEPVELQVQWHPAVQPKTPVSLKINSFPEAQPSNRATATAAPNQPVVLPAPDGKGLYIIEAQLLEGDQVRAIYHSAFWIRDESSLRSGPRLGLNPDYFELDGRPLAVVGTTYMSSEVQPLFRASQRVRMEQRPGADSRCRTEHDPHRLVERLGQILR